MYIYVFGWFSSSINEEKKCVKKKKRKKKNYAQKVQQKLAGLLPIFSLGTGS